LIDLLNAHNQYFSGLVGLTPPVASQSRGLSVSFVGRLLAYLKTPKPVEAARLSKARQA
jgi:hypothetical protein